MSAARGRAENRSAAERRTGADPRGRFGIWLSLHLYGLVSSLGRIAARPWATVLTIGVMAVALALPLALWLTLDNLERFSGSVRESREIGLFLKPQIALPAAQALAGQLRQRPDVAAVAVRSPDDGLAEFREMSDLAPALDLLEHNPLPSVLVVDPVDDGEALAAALAGLDEVEIVQHDALWRQRLDAWLTFGGRVVWVVALMLGAGALLVVGNTVRLDIQSREEEITVLQQLGASDAFVRRPFLYLGAWYGLVAGVLALAVVVAAGVALQSPLSQLVASYGSSLRLQGLPLPDLARVLAAAAALGWLGAWLAVGHHLRRTRPTDV